MWPYNHESGSQHSLVSDVDGDHRVGHEGGDGGPEVEEGVDGRVPERVRKEPAEVARVVVQRDEVGEVDALEGQGQDRGEDADGEARRGREERRPPQKPEHGGAAREEY